MVSTVKSPYGPLKALWSYIMPIPTPRDTEPRQNFMSRCMADDVMRQEYEETPQRWAVCNTQWEAAKKDANELQGRLD